MFFHKRTGTGSADLVHLKIHNFTVLDADVFAVLPADLKDSIRLRHPVRSALCLRGDLIPHGIGTDALADTLDSRNASGSLERDTDVASLGRLTDFIHVAEGWEEAVAHALDQYASAIVVPAAGNMLHALERAREDKLGKAVVLTASIAGDPATEPGTESEESSAENTAAAPQSVSALAALVTANPDAENPAQAEAVVHTVRLLLADVAAAGTADEAQQIVASGEAMRAVTKNGETFTHGVAAVGGSSISQSDLSLAARRDKALAQVKQLAAQDGGMAEQVAEAKTKRDEAARLVDQESAKRTEARLKAQQAEKSLKSATDRVASFTRQLEQLDRKITETQENRNEHQRKLDDLNRALASAQQSTAEHADFDELDERERTLERELNLTREHEVAAKIAWTEASRKGESLSRQAGLLRDNAKEAAERRARIEALNDRRREQAAHLQGVADDARAVAAMVEHTLHDVAAKRDELQAAASSHDEELKALRAQRNQIEPKVTDLTGREHALDVNRERLAAESGQLMQKVSDELGLTLEELVSGYGPEQPVPVLDDEGNPVPLDETEAEAETEEGETGGETGTNGDSARFKTVPYNRQEQKKRLDKARRDLAALGKINPLATEEFEALEERNKYLNDQRNDVVKSRDDLMQLIKDLDSTMVQVFKSAFDDTAEAFEQMFATLFPGGTGRLRLENPEDMLTTGVLVEASPAGKAKEILDKSKLPHGFKAIFKFFDAINLDKLLKIGIWVILGLAVVGSVAGGFNALASKPTSISHSSSSSSSSSPSSSSSSKPAQDDSAKPDENKPSHDDQSSQPSQSKEEQVSSSSEATVCCKLLAVCSVREDKSVLPLAISWLAMAMLLLANCTCPTSWAKLLCMACKSLCKSATSSFPVLSMLWVKSPMAMALASFCAWARGRQMASIFIHVSGPTTSKVSNTAAKNSHCASSFTEAPLASKAWACSCNCICKAPKACWAASRCW